MENAVALSAKERTSLLLVDDDAAVLRMTRRRLERHGYDVVACSSGEEAFGWLEQQKSMVKLCHEMGKKIIAEGVEQAEERDALLHLGCDYLQGYFYAKPGPPFPMPRR